MAQMTSIYRSPGGRAEIMALYEGVLARWPARNTQTYLPTRHGHTFVVVTGDRHAPALVPRHQPVRAVALVHALPIDDC